MTINWIRFHVDFFFSGKIPVSLSVRVGSDSHDSGGLILKLNRFIQHESYKSPVHDFDYALLELTDSLNYTDKIQAVELPKILNFIDERSCTVSGWGNSDFQINSNLLPTYWGLLLPFNRSNQKPKSVQKHIPIILSANCEA